jgi:HAD superfamily hydrolase (TIGR01549 family)
VAENQRYKAVVIDLFDTLVNWNPEGLPMVTWRGREMRSTTPLLVPVLEAGLGARFDWDAFMDAHDAVYREILAARSHLDALEVTCLERFTRTLGELGVDRGVSGPLAENLRRIHMERVREVTHAPPARVDAMKKIAAQFRIGMISNFDDSETGHLIMHDTGIKDLFDAIIISADTGLRKPNQRIFRKILEAMNLQAHEVLFVGDTPQDDIVGAARVGMRTAWINRHRKPVPEGVPPPDITIADLAELPAAIGI